jgi:hypothetical protein
MVLPDDLLEAIAAAVRVAVAEVLASADLNGGGRIDSQVRSASNASTVALPASPDAWITRQKTAELLRERGIPMSPATLATRVSRPGPLGAPPFAKFGRRPLYRVRDVLAWAEACLYIR